MVPARMKPVVGRDVLLEQLEEDVVISPFVNGAEAGMSHDVNCAILQISVDARCGSHAKHSDSVDGV